MRLLGSNADWVRIVRGNLLPHKGIMGYRLLVLASAIAFFGSPCAAEKLKPIFTYEDYPRDAIRAGMEGTVIVDLTVSERGTVADCRIVKSSGYRILDDTTCRLITERAKFIPEKDSNGIAIKSTYRPPPITWSLRR